MAVELHFFFKIMMIILRQWLLYSVHFTSKENFGTGQKIILFWSVRNGNLNNWTLYRCVENLESSGYWRFLFLFLILFFLFILFDLSINWWEILFVSFVRNGVCCSTDENISALRVQPVKDDKFEMEMFVSSIPCNFSLAKWNEKEIYMCYLCVHV